MRIFDCDDYLRDAKFFRIGRYRRACIKDTSSEIVGGLKIMKETLDPGEKVYLQEMSKSVN